MFLEVIGLTPEDVIAIQQGGGQRVELVSAMEHDGLSPSLAAIESALAVATIPIRVMVRLHHRGFVYSKSDVADMVAWIKTVRQLPVDGFVLGAITPQGHIDEYCLAQCLTAIDGKGCTFHRAFDRVDNQFDALATLGRYAVDTILTSGGLDLPIAQNLAHLAALQKQAPEIAILAGGGVNQTIIEDWKNSPIHHFHVGSACRPSGDFLQPVDVDLVKACVLRGQ